MQNDIVLLEVATIIRLFFGDQMGGHNLEKIILPNVPHPPYTHHILPIYPQLNQNHYFSHLAVKFAATRGKKIL